MLTVENREVGFNKKDKGNGRLKRIIDTIRSVYQGLGSVPEGAWPERVAGGEEEPRRGIVPNHPNI